MYDNHTDITSFNHLQPNSLINSEETGGCQSDLLMLIMKIQPIFLLIFGFVANLCSFIVLIQPRLRRLPTFSYIAFLSLSNALLSLIHAFFTIIGVYFGLTLENLSLFIFCRLLNRFFIDFLTHFSLYTLTAVDLDRVRTVTSSTNNTQRYNPENKQRQHGCGKVFLRVCLIELSFVIVLFFLNLHWLTSYGYTVDNIYMDPTEHITMCTINHSDGHSLSYGNYLTSILPIIEVILFGIVPFAISVIATIIILRHVSLKYTSLNAQNKHLKQSRRRMELHVSVLLISLNCVFILFTTPHNIFTVYVGRLRHRLDNKPSSEGELCSIAFTQKSLDLLQQCYFMSTFFLYILTNKRFREEFYRLFKCFIFNFCRNNNASPSTTDTVILRHRNINNNNNINHNHLLAPSRDVFGSHMSVSDALHDEELD